MKNIIISTVLAAFLLGCQKPSITVQAPITQPEFNILTAKTVDDLPPGYLPKDNDLIAVFTELPDGTTLGIDGASWKLENDHASFLVVIRPPEDAVDKEGNSIGSVVIKQEFDCKGHQYKYDYAILIGEGKKILNIRNDYKWVPIQQGSMGEKVEEKVCTQLNSNGLVEPPAGHKYKTLPVPKSEITNI